MAKKDEFQGVDLTPIESQLLSDSKIGVKLKRGERIKVSDLPISVQQNLGLSKGQYINIKPDVLSKLGFGEISRNRKFMPNTDIVDTVNVEPIQSLQDIFRQAIRPSTQGTAGEINVSAGKGVKKAFKQRKEQEIPMRDTTNKSIMDILREYGRSLQQVPADMTGITLLQRLLAEGQYGAQMGTENLLRLLQSQLNKPRPMSQEQTVLSAIRQATGQPARESAGAVVQVGNKRYRMDASGRIVQIVEPVV